MRTAAQCVGRVLRGKTDWGLMIFADRVSLRIRDTCCFISHNVFFWEFSYFRFRFRFRWQRFARADKRSKLPKWINQYITETASNLSTDMALVLSKLFMRQISQNPNENQTGISLWSLEDVLRAQLKAKQLAYANEDAPAVEVRMEIEDDEGEFGADDAMLAEVDLEL